MICFKSLSLKSNVAPMTANIRELHNLDLHKLMLKKSYASHLTDVKLKHRI